MKVQSSKEGQKNLSIGAPPEGSKQGVGLHIVIRFRFLVRKLDAHSNLGTGKKSVSGKPKGVFKERICINLHALGD
jgi:hypothetical protein